MGAQFFGQSRRSGPRGGFSCAQTHVHLSSESLSMHLRVAGEVGCSQVKLHARRSANQSKTHDVLNRSEKPSYFADSAGFDSLKRRSPEEWQSVERAYLIQSALT
jgi:hypothetical protein